MEGSWGNVILIFIDKISFSIKLAEEVNRRFIKKSVTDLTWVY